MPDYTAELAAVDAAILAVLNRKGVKSITIRGRSLVNMSLEELRAFRASILRSIERERSPFGTVHGVAQRQGGP